MLKRLELKIIFRIVLLFITLLACAFLMVMQQFVYVIFLMPVLICQVMELFRFQNKANKEFNQFVESIQYRDFSRNFDVKHAPAELKELRENFNRVNSTLKGMSIEKETSFHYLEKILELVDTGIISYDLDSREVIWMNESLKKMLQLPYLKNIHSLEKRDEQLFNDVVSMKPGEGKITMVRLEKVFQNIIICDFFSNRRQKIYAHRVSKYQ